QQHRIMPGQHHHGRAEPHALRAPGKVAQEVERGGELAYSRKVMLDHEHAVIAELLRRQHIIDVLLVAEAVADRPLSGRLGAAEQPELHAILPRPDEADLGSYPPSLAQGHRQDRWNGADHTQFDAETRRTIVWGACIAAVRPHCSEGSMGSFRV